MLVERQFPVKSINSYTQKQIHSGGRRGTRRYLLIDELLYNARRPFCLSFPLQTVTRKVCEKKKENTLSIYFFAGNLSIRLAKVYYFEGRTYFVENIHIWYTIIDFGGVCGSSRSINAKRRRFTALKHSYRT